MSQLYDAQGNPIEPGLYLYCDCPQLVVQEEGRFYKQAHHTAANIPLTEDSARELYRPRKDELDERIREWEQDSQRRFNGRVWFARSHMPQ